MDSYEFLLSRADSLDGKNKNMKTKNTKVATVKKTVAVKTESVSLSPKMLRNACISLRMDGNAFWSGKGVASKKAICSALLAFAKGKAVKALSGPDTTLLHVSGQMGNLVWKVALSGNVYSRNCPESGRVTGLLSALKAGGVSVRTVKAGEVVKIDSKYGVDRECVAVYSLPTAKE